MVTKATDKVSKGAQGIATSASAWKKQTVQGTPLTVPSGNVCLVRAPGMSVFLKQGVIPNGLMPMIQDAMDKGKVPDDASLDASLGAMLEDPEKLQQLVDLTDAVAVYCCLEPKLEHPPQEMNSVGVMVTVPFDNPLRNPDVLYVDEVDFNDKMFIFTYAVGGTADLERFRQES